MAAPPARKFPTALEREAAHEETDASDGKGGPSWQAEGWAGETASEAGGCKWIDLGRRRAVSASPTLQRICHPERSDGSPFYKKHK
jgi:hypothetical protein